MEKKNFSVGEIVWAKLEKYPFWPAKIASESIAQELRDFKEEKGVGVLFFGKQLTYGLVSEKYIKNFKDNLEEFSKIKMSKEEREDFKVAIKMAIMDNNSVDPPLELLEEDRPVKMQKRASSKKAKHAEEEIKKVSIQQECTNVEISKAIPEEKTEQSCITEDMVGDCKDTATFQAIAGEVTVDQADEAKTEECKETEQTFIAETIQADTVVKELPQDQVVADNVNSQSEPEIKKHDESISSLDEIRNDVPMNSCEATDKETVTEEKPVSTVETKIEE